MKDAVAQVAETGSAESLEGYHRKLKDANRLLMDVTDMEKSEAYQAEEFDNLLDIRTEMVMEYLKEPSTLYICQAASLQTGGHVPGFMMERAGNMKTAMLQDMDGSSTFFASEKWNEGD